MADVCPTVKKLWLGKSYFLTEIIDKALNKKFILFYWDRFLHVDFKCKEKQQKKEIVSEYALHT